MWFRLLRLLALLFTVGLLLRLLLAWLRPSRRNGVSARPRGREPERLVQDPQCGVRLPASRAILHEGRYYCSRACAELGQQVGP